MELTQQYLDQTTLIADFWIADRDNKIQSFANEGITIEKSKVYLKSYFINVYIKKEHYGELELFAKDWEKKYPKVVITKASGRVEAYEVRLKKAVEKENNWVLEMAGEKMED
jgi:hypothetical protein